MDLNGIFCSPIQFIRLEIELHCNPKKWLKMHQPQCCTKEHLLYTSHTHWKTSTPVDPTSYTVYSCLTVNYKKQNFQQTILPSDDLSQTWNIDNCQNIQHHQAHPLKCSNCRNDATKCNHFGAPKNKNSTKQNSWLNWLKWKSYTSPHLKHLPQLLL